MLKLTNTIILIAVLTVTSAKASNINNKTKQINYYKKTRIMSISINLYRVRKAEKIEEITDLKNELLKAKLTKVDLYKMTGDLTMIFNNTTNPFADEKTISSKLMFGYPTGNVANNSQVGGFLPTSEVSKVVDWIKLNKIDTEEGFLKKYDNTSKEVKKELDDWGSTKSEILGLYELYVKPLVAFYYDALKNKNSIVITGE